MTGFRRATKRATLATTGIFAIAIAIARPADAQRATRPLTLTEALSLAKERAPQVHAAFARIAGAEAVVARSRAAHLPTVSAAGMGTVFASRGPVFVSGLSSNVDSSQQTLVAQASLNLQW